MMKIEVRLFASFRSFLPAGNTGFSIVMEVEEGTAVAGLITRLGLPEDIPKVTIIKGNQVRGDYEIQEGDTVSIFPPIAGG